MAEEFIEDILAQEPIVEGEAKVDDDTKRRYAKIFRCQISEEELILLRYNALTVNLIPL